MLKLFTLAVSFMAIPAFAADPPRILFPDSFYSREADQPDWITQEAQAALLARVLERHGHDLQKTLHDPEFLTGATRSQYLNDFESVLRERANGEIPSNFTVLDLTKTLNKPKFDSEKKAQQESYGNALDLYESGSLDAKYAFDTTLLLMVQAEFARVSVAEVSGWDDLPAWERKYVNDPARRISLFQLLMLNASTPADLGYFMGFYIDNARKRLAGGDFATEWERKFSMNTNAAMTAFDLPPNWIVETMYPELLANSGKKTGWNGPNAYDLGFNITLQSFIEVALAEEVVPDFSKLDNDFQLQNAIHVLSSYIVKDDLKDKAKWKASTKKFLKWTLPAGVKKEFLQGEFDRISYIEDFEVFKTEWENVRKLVETPGIEYSYSFGGALWNVPFQLELQKFLMESGVRDILPPEHFFYMTAFQGNQLKQIEIYKAYLDSLKTEEDLMFVTQKISERLVQDWSWAYMKDLDVNPFFHQNARALSEALWNRYRWINGPTATKHDWIVDSFKAIVNLTRFDSGPKGFLALVSVFEPIEFQKASVELMANKELIEAYEKKQFQLVESFKSALEKTASDCAIRTLN